MSLLAIDGGASATKWRLQDRTGAELSNGHAPPLHGHLFDEAVRATSRQVLRQLANSVRSKGDVKHLVAGITGLGAGSDVAKWYMKVLAEQFDIDEAHVLVADDLSLVCLGTLRPGRGILIYAGTGSVGYYLSADFRPLRAGGYGYLIDDAGGGYWIGSRALSWLLREQDVGRKPNTPLATALVARFGSDDWNIIRDAVYAGGRTLVASCSRQVLEAAEADDSEAINILREAGQELGDLANRLFEASGTMASEVCLIGGVSACGEMVASAMRARLVPELALIPATAEGAEAICRAVEIHGLEGLSALL
jgi:N-acetylglucosamine kinase-like BadF-type ATPase